MKRHTFVFLGTTELNPRINLRAPFFINRHAGHTPIRRPKLDGLVFGFMEAPEGIVVTQVDEVPLKKRIPVVARRHLEGGGLGPSGRDVGEDAARNVISDVIAHNPTLKPRISEKRSKLRSR